MFVFCFFFLSYFFILKLTHCGAFFLSFDLDEQRFRYSCFSSNCEKAAEPLAEEAEDLRDDSFFLPSNKPIINS